MRHTTLLVLALLVFSACDMVQVYQGEIEEASRGLEVAKTDAERATLYAERGRAYSNKARLALVRHQIDRNEYLRLFALAVEDTDRAVALAPDDAQVHFKRGLSNYDRAAQVEDLVETDHTQWFDAARSDFATAAQKDPSFAAAHDYLGVVDEQTERIDDAVVAYTKVMALDARLGKMRLTDLYCNRGQAHLGAKDLELAAEDFEKSIAFNGPTDGCSCEPYNPLAYIYIDATGQYEKGWDLVRKAQSAGHPIAREYVERLERASRRPA